MTAGGGDFLAIAVLPKLTRLHDEARVVTKLGQANSVNRTGQLPIVGFLSSD